MGCDCGCSSFRQAHPWQHLCWGVLLSGLRYLLPTLGRTLANIGSPLGVSVQQLVVCGGCFRRSSFALASLLGCVAEVMENVSSPVRLCWCVPGCLCCVLCGWSVWFGVLVCLPAPPLFRSVPCCCLVWCVFMATNMLQHNNQHHTQKALAASDADNSTNTTELPKGTALNTQCTRHNTQPTRKSSAETLNPHNQHLCLLQGTANIVGLRSGPSTQLAGGFGDTSMQTCTPSNITQPDCRQWPATPNPQT